MLIARFDVVEMVVLWGDGREKRFDDNRRRRLSSVWEVSFKLMAGSASMFPYPWIRKLA